MKPLQKFLFAIGFVTLYSPIAFGWRSFKIIFTSFPYEFDADYTDVKVQILNNTAGDTTINIVINLNEDIDDLTLSLLMALESETGEYTALFNRTVNLCKFLKQRNTEPMLRLVYEDLLKHGNFIKNCPVKKGVYSLREYRVDEEMLPSYIPETNFLVGIKLDFRNKCLFDGKLHGKIDKSKGFNNLKMFSLG